MYVCFSIISSVFSFNVCLCFRCLICSYYSIIYELSPPYAVALMKVCSWRFSCIRKLASGLSWNNWKILAHNVILHGFKSQLQKCGWCVLSLSNCVPIHMLDGLMWRVTKRSISKRVKFRMGCAKHKLLLWCGFSNWLYGESYNTFKCCITVRWGCSMALEVAL